MASTYDPNAPTGLVNLDVDYQSLQLNFQQANISFGINHYPFTDNTANNGKHKFVEMPILTGIPPGLASAEFTLYSKNVSGNSQLFSTRGVTGIEVQLTGPGVPITTTNGSTFLAGGLLIQWGKKATPGSTGSVIFPVAFSSAPFSIQLTLQRTSGSQSVTIDNATPPSVSQFNYLSSSPGSDFLYWMAIGLG